MWLASTSKMRTFISRISNEVTGTARTNQAFVYFHDSSPCGSDTAWKFQGSQTSYTKVGLPQSEHFKVVKTEDTIQYNWRP